MNEQIQKWSGEFGNEYLKRNRVDWVRRIPFWTNILTGTMVRSILEVGCNAGWNLLALRTIKPKTSIFGIDVNRTSVEQARSLGLSAEVGTAVECERWTGSNAYELVFTAGVLIHVGPEDLQDTMKSIVSLSRQYVLAIEYASEKQEQVIYRNHVNMLWKRPYGKLYEEMGLKLVETGDAGPGFDNCTYFLMSK